MFRKIILIIMCMIFIAQPIVADEAAKTYLSGEYFEYLGLFDDAKKEYEQALSLFKTKGDEIWIKRTQDAIDRLNKITKEKSEDMIAVPSNWKFLGELKLEDSKTQYFHTKDREFVSITKIPTDLSTRQVYDLMTEMKDKEYRLLKDAKANCQEQTYSYSCKKDVSTIIKKYSYVMDKKAIFVTYASVKNENVEDFYNALKNPKVKVKEGSSLWKWGLSILVIAVCLVIFRKKGKKKSPSKMFVKRKKKRKKKKR
tara:strand:- start:20651 stop:21415 length:765 start_codon:yes stop_codon:yes gene_type:complete